MTPALLRAHTTAVLRAAHAYRVEMHCRHCGVLVTVAPNRPKRRECDQCRGRVR